MQLEDLAIQARVDTFKHLALTHDKDLLTVGLKQKLLEITTAPHVQTHR